MSFRYWLALILIIGCGGRLLYQTPRPTVPFDARILPASFRIDLDHYSNIMPADYVGAETCGDCHDEQYDLWLNHPHRKMNQLPSEDTVLGDFNDAVLELPTGQIRFTTALNPDGSTAWLMTVRRAGRVLRQYQVTRTVGSRYIQSYIGKQVAGPESSGHAIYQEHKLPYSWRLGIRQWLPSDYFNICCDEPLVDGLPQDEALDQTPRVKLYTEICKNCHNTIPYAYRIFSPPLVGFRDARVAAAVDSLAARLAESHGGPVPDGKTGTASMVSRFIGRMDPDRHMVSLGIGCESCHLGGREHVEYERHIRFLPTSGYTRIVPLKGKPALVDSRSDSRTLLGTCTQCHSGNNPLLPNGAAKGNSREALDLLAGFCTSQLGCVDCHEPHTASPSASGGPDSQVHIDVCLKCHERFQDREQATAHSGHRDEIGVSCLDCHMPRYTRGVDALIRTHRISHPVEASMINAGSANACNTCHLNQSTRWTLKQMSDLWGRKFQIDADAPVAGKLDQPVGEMWLASEDSHLRLMAIQLYARSPLGEQMLEPIIRGLNDPERINRVFAIRAAAKLAGQPRDQRLPVDIVQSPAIRQQQIESWLRELASQKPGVPGPPATTQ